MFSPVAGAPARYAGHPDVADGQTVVQARGGEVLAVVPNNEAGVLRFAVITVGEIERGVRRLPAGARRTRFERWVANDLPAFFSERLLSFDLDCAVHWGAIMADAEHVGRQRPGIDAQIAATARRHGLAVATRGGRGFTGIAVPVVDPWTDTA